MLNVAAWFKEYIHSRGLKSCYVATRADIPRDRLSRILSGSRKMTAEEFIRLCAALNVDLDQIREQVV